MASHLKCTGETKQDCWECHQFYSSHSLHYDEVEDKKVSEISCSFGGNRKFDEDGRRVD